GGPACSTLDEWKVRARRRLLPLDLVDRVLAQTGAVLFQAFFQAFGQTALDIDLGPVVQVTGFGALEPDILAGVALLLGHRKVSVSVNAPPDDGGVCFDRI